MASIRETRAVAEVLSDPANAERSAEEVAEAAIAALDGLRKETHRFVAIFQPVKDGGQSPGWPFIVGPYSTYLQAMRACEWYGTPYDQLARLGIRHRRMIGITIGSMDAAARLCVEHFVNAKDDAGARIVIEHVKQRSL